MTDDLTVMDVVLLPIIIGPLFSLQEKLKDIMTTGKKKEIIINEIGITLANKTIKELKSIKINEFDKYIEDIHSKSKNVEWFSEELYQWIQNYNTDTEFQKRISKELGKKILREEEQLKDLKVILREQLYINAFKEQPYTHCIGIYNIYFFKLDVDGEIKYSYENNLTGPFKIPEFNIIDKSTFIKEIRNIYNKKTPLSKKIKSQLDLIIEYINRDEVSIFKIPRHKYK